MLKIAAMSVLVVAAADANAQSLSGRATSAAVSGGVGAMVSGAASVSAFGGGSNPYGALNDSGSGPSAGGGLPGALGVKMGDKVITFRGAVGVGDDRANFRAGAGIPF
jgi:hypothetical protein